jgi:hypothetical protein
VWLKVIRYPLKIKNKKMQVTEAPIICFNTAKFDMYLLVNYLSGGK